MSEELEGMKSTLLRCPDCDGPVKFYHASHKYGDGITRVVCLNKCRGWKVIMEIHRSLALMGGKG
jgi:predicted nuclease of restriction endonuclease-like RecB superfamily